MIFFLRELTLKFSYWFLKTKVDKLAISNEATNWWPTINKGWFKFVFKLITPKVIWDPRRKRIEIKNFQLFMNKIRSIAATRTITKIEIVTGSANNLWEFKIKQFWQPKYAILHKGRSSSIPKKN